MTGAKILPFRPRPAATAERVPVGGCDIDIADDLATCGYSASFIEYGDAEGEFVARDARSVLGTFDTLEAATAALWRDAAATHGIHRPTCTPVPEWLAGCPSEVEPDDVPEWAANKGFHVFRDAVEGAWIAAHLDPDGAHGSNFAPYRTKREAVARCIREASR